MIASLPASPRITTADQALTLIQSGQRVYIGGGCGVPTPLLEALVKRAPTLRNIEIIHSNLGNGPSLQAYYRSGDKTGNSKPQRLQSCNESRVVAF